ASPRVGLQIGAWTGAGVHHNGQVDDFRIYKRVLSAAEVQLLFAGNSEPPIPTGLSAAPGDTQLTVSWNPSPGAASYNLSWSLNYGGPFTNLIPVTRTTYTLTGLTNGTPDNFAVRAVNALGPNRDSPQDAAKPVPPPP